MTGSLLRDAFAHHLWATQRIIDTCADLTPEQLRTPAPGTYGAIIDTLRHLIASDRWNLSFFRDDVEAVDEKADLTLGDLRSVMKSNGTAWTQLLAGELDPDADTVEIDDGLEVRDPVPVRLAQVLHHGTDHRSQICTALTSLGVTPPEIDLWAYARETGRERAARLNEADVPTALSRD
jgi:uncharacterized damage-inducible protein DinB